MQVRVKHAYIPKLHRYMNTQHTHLHTYIQHTTYQHTHQHTKGIQNWISTYCLLNSEFGCVQFGLILLLWDLGRKKQFACKKQWLNHLGQQMKWQLQETRALQVEFSSILPTDGYRLSLFGGSPIALHGLVHFLNTIEPSLTKVIYAYFDGISYIEKRTASYRIEPRMESQAIESKFNDESKSKIESQANELILIKNRLLTPILPAGLESFRIESLIESH